MQSKQFFFRYFCLCILIPILSPVISVAQAIENQSHIEWTCSPVPQKAVSGNNGNHVSLRNSLLELNILLSNHNISDVSFKDLRTGKSVKLPAPFFYLDIDSGRLTNSKAFEVSKKLQIIDIKGNPEALRLSDRFSGKGLTLSLTDRHSGISVDWTVILKDGSNYIRQCFKIRNSGGRLFTVKDIGLLHLSAAYLPENSIGTVPGSPYLVPATDIIAAIELPGFIPKKDSLDTGTWLHVPSAISFGPDAYYSFSTMIGIFPAAQRRRTFSYYVERERASPLRHYLHYNDWYDLGLEPSDTALIRVIKAYKKELYEKRGIALDGVVLDDGWDNYKTALWQFDSSKFPHALTDVKDTAADSGVHSLGIWISPFGGYGGQEERFEYAKKHGILPPTATGFDLSNESYYQFFKERCLQLIRHYNIHYFKWDNAAPYENEGLTFGNLQSTAHFLNLCRIALELRKQDPSLFINTTVGTWPSPFWLNYVDCTWKMGKGGDVNWIGSGDNRERWLNFRDASIYQLVIKRGPLYPLNSMMFHGIVLGKFFQGKTVALAGNHLKNEVRSYFALGPDLQELYISPDLMDSTAWDDLADAIKWNRKNAEVLYDSHWVKGDPGNFEPYAVAAWKHNKGILMLRNPNNYPRDISIDAVDAFELPVNAKKDYLLQSPYREQRIQTMQLNASQKVVITLQPFEVLVFDAGAAK